MLRSTEVDAIAREQNGNGMGWEFRERLNGREDLALSFNLVCENRSPNREQELSAGELNGWERKREKIT